MADQHLSIGEVLSLLQDEFPDVTISKIRFLESQGLIDPERTPSGYRKFYASDIERLRWILIQQRENFLPLKVIKDRLGSVEAPTNGAIADPSDADSASPSTQATNPAERSSAQSGTGGASSPPRPAPVATVRASMPAGEAPTQEPIWMADLARNARATRPAEAAPAAEARPVSPAPSHHLDHGPSEVSLNAAELVAAAGITTDDLRELVQFGLVMGHPMGDDTYYDGDALIIARKSAAFLGHGIGARHLRMFKVAAEREAGFLEQVAMPLLKQRNPEARRQAVALVEELCDLGHDLRAALLRANLRHHLDRN
ncbi:MAG: MerR family transcriptional regulator [Aquihabitans sp.]